MRGEYERKANRETRQFGAEGSAQKAAPRGFPGGFFYGITDGDIDRGSTGGTVSIWMWSITDDDWIDTGDDMAHVRSFFPNIGETVPADTAVRVEWYLTTWVISNWYCSVADWN